MTSYLKSVLCRRTAKIRKDGFILNGREAVVCSVERRADRLLSWVVCRVRGRGWNGIIKETRCNSSKAMVGVKTVRIFFLTVFETESV